MCVEKEETLILHELSTPLWVSHVCCDKLEVISFWIASAEFFVFCFEQPPGLTCELVRQSMLRIPSVLGVYELRPCPTARFRVVWCYIPFWSQNSRGSSWSDGRSALF